MEARFKGRGPWKKACRCCCKPSKPWSVTSVWPHWYKASCSSVGFFYTLSRKSCRRVAVSGSTNT